MMKAEYTKDNTAPFTVAEMTGLFRSHEIVTFTIPGVGETCAETAMFRDALEELQQLAAKGLGAEQAEREIEQLIAGYAQSRDSAQEYEDQINYEGVRKGLWLAMHRLKGVSSNGR